MTTMTSETNVPHAAAPRGWFSRERALVLVLVAITVIFSYLCFLLIVPFLSPLAWALALALLANPIYNRIVQRTGHKNRAALMTVGVVAIGIVGPAAFVAQQIVSEATQGVQTLQESFKGATWEQIAQAHPRLAPAAEWLQQRVDVPGELQRMAGTITSHVPSVLSGSIWFISELLITLFVLFYLFRDRQLGMQRLRSFLPLSNTESDDVMRRVADTIHATLYGTLVVSVMEGVLGGLMFWALGLPAPLLWGVVMTLSGIVPVFGPFIVWLPAALFLAATGSYGFAVVVLVGGSIFALIGHFLYPVLVGQRIQMHPLPVFFSFLGGLAVFGAVGLILGPTIFAITEALLDVWRARTADGRTASEAELQS